MSPPSSAEATDAHTVPREVRSSPLHERHVHIHARFSPDNERESGNLSASAHTPSRGESDEFHVFSEPCDCVCLCVFLWVSVCVVCLLVVCAFVYVAFVCVCFFVCVVCLSCVYFVFFICLSVCMCMSLCCDFVLLVCICFLVCIFLLVRIFVCICVSCTRRISYIGKLYKISITNTIPIYFLFQCARDR